MKVAAIVLTVAAPLMATGATVLQPVQPSPTAVADGVSQIVRSRCVPCHQPGGDAPFSLTSLDEIRRRASMIVQVTRSGYMPPWKPVDGFGQFRDARRLTTLEIEHLERWVQLGAPDGSMPPAPARETGAPWPIGEPDVVVELPSYELRAEGPDVFRNFVVTIPRHVKGFVRGTHFRPRNRAVHHANIRVDLTETSRRMDASDPQPGYEGLIARSADFPDGQFLGWTPGQLGPVLSDELAWQIHGGTDLVVQLHLRPTGKVETVAPIIGLYLGNQPPPRTPTMIRLGRQDLDIPSNAAAHTVRDSFTLPVDVEARAVQPHAHYRARRLEGWAVLPDGSRQPLIRIDDWDVNWQDRYVYATPIQLPAGTRLDLTYTFDNSAANPRNPTVPTLRSRWGWRSTDEMADLWLQVIARSESDRRRLAREVSGKMLTEDAVGSEVLLEREPGHVNLRNDAASTYLALGKPSQALRHFEVVRRLQPRSAAAWFNVGVAQEMLGRTGEAESNYAEAIRIDPQYAPAHNNRGALMLRKGEVIDARKAFHAALESDDTNADAHANLGMALIATGDADAALRHIDRAVRLRPELLSGLTPHVWLLCAHADAAVRRPALGEALGERIRSASEGPRAAILDPLAACYAALGSFERAVALATEAELAISASASELRQAIRDRIALYRRGRAYVLPR